jgi:hypothetical protein
MTVLSTTYPSLLERPRTLNEDEAQRVPNSKRDKCKRLTCVAPFPFGRIDPGVVTGKLLGALAEPGYSRATRADTGGGASFSSAKRWR